MQVGVISEQGTKKSPATLDEVQAASAGAASACCNSSKCSACPSNCMWGLFLVGWLFPPAWWAGTFKGLRCGKDDEYFIKRREGTPTIAWAANLLMSLVSAVVLILVLAIIFGRPGPQQEGGFDKVSCRNSSTSAAMHVHVGDCADCCAGCRKLMWATVMLSRLIAILQLSWSVPDVSDYVPACMQAVVWRYEHILACAVPANVDLQDPTSLPSLARLMFYPTSTIPPT